MTSTVQIRAAEPADLPRVAALAGALVRMHHAANPDRFFLPDDVEKGEMIARLEERGAPRIVLSTMVDNEPAQRAFRGCGFQATMVEMTRSGRPGP